MDPAKRDAVRKALAEHPTQSNKAISRIAGVSDHLVAAVRRLAAEEMTQRLATHRVAGLNRKRIERPEAALSQLKNSAATEPAKAHEESDENRRPYFGQ